MVQMHISRPKIRSKNDLNMFYDDPATRSDVHLKFSKIPISNQILTTFLFRKCENQGVHLSPQLKIK